MHELWLQRGKESSNSKLRLFGLIDLKYIVTQDDWEVFNGARFLFHLCLELSVVCQVPCPTWVLNEFPSRRVPKLSLLLRFAHGDHLITGALDFEIMIRSTYVMMLSPDDKFFMPCRTLRPQSHLSRSHDKPEPVAHNSTRSQFPPTRTIVQHADARLDHLYQLRSSGIFRRAETI